MPGDCRQAWRVPPREGAEPTAGPIETPRVTFHRSVASEYIDVIANIIVIIDGKVCQDLYEFLLRCGADPALPIDNAQRFSIIG